MWFKSVADVPKLVRPAQFKLLGACFYLLVGSLPLANLLADDARLIQKLDADYRLPDMAKPVSADEHDKDMLFEKRSLESFNAVEWQIRLRASADRRFDDESKLDSLVSTLQIPLTEKVTLHWGEGSHARVTDFQPMSTPLIEGKGFTISSFGGRSSDGALPYFNLESAGGGIIIAIGWSGNWRFQVERIKSDKIQLRAGLANKKFALRKDENVRFPSILLMGYQGSWIDGQNKLRRLLSQRYSPQGRSFEELMPVAGSVHGVIGFNDTTETNLLEMLEQVSEIKHLDTFWLDAGWNEGGFPAGQGNPQHSAERYPRGLVTVGEQVKEKGLRFLAWFEPERVMRGSKLYHDHPQWLLKPLGTPVELRYQEKDGFFLFDLGNHEARKWMVETISKQLTENNIEIYRQDCNLYPAYFWGNALTPESEVSNEVQYITGLYEFLDELQRRHPNVLFDQCASGGRRIDFEMLRRSVVLWRSDNTWGDPSSPRNMQAMTHGLSHWIPLHGLGATAVDEISLRSGMGACASFAINYRSPQDRQQLEQYLVRYKPVRDVFSKDYYPLTPWTTDPNQWLAFQFHDPERGRGILQAFRSKGSKVDSPSFQLMALDKDAIYEVQDWDESKIRQMTGQELMTSGLKAAAVETDDIAKVYFYSRAK